jgi:predicted nucleic acid-binding protein
VIRAFLDANVLFTAAHNPSGKAALVIALGAEGYWEVVTSTLPVEEARHNIALKYPHTLDTFENLTASLRIIRSGTGRRCPIPLSSKNRPILEAAIKARTTHLLTGDVKHFGHYMNRPHETGGVAVMTVAEFLAQVVRRP